uniref:NIF3-like protein 1 n=1 Tax=Saccoglossus kowalevskii TaxID=10224 RepID=A0ABM0GKT8_SACKO|nr:PREDICTED: putative GTP cyclohydrolase 1 type 2 NIF3L1-like [Saccoglossus kowalevskii]
MDLDTVVSKLETLAPTTLAEPWDNVGLLVEPSHPHIVNRMFLTNDLTEDVLKEAIEKRSDFILSYHPPIFSPLKRLTCQSTKERIIVKCIENRIAVYSPHTCYDAMKDGVNDWLILAIGKGKIEPVHSITAKCHATTGGFKVETYIKDETQKTTIASDLKAISGVDVVTLPTLETNTVKLSLNCTDKAVLDVMQYLKKYDDVKGKTEIIALSKPPIPGAGSGRKVKLDQPLSVSAIIQNVKGHLKLPYVRLALGRNKSTDSIVHNAAVCAGSGSSVLQGCSADLYLTGEMSHHEVLDAVSRGTTVILCDHSNTERGYLSELRDKLTVLFEDKVDVHVSGIDKDPLQIV